MTTPRAAAPSHREPRRARSPSTGQGPRPLALALALSGAAAIVWFVLRTHASHHVTLTFERAEATVPSLELTFFPDQLAFATPSPPPPYGNLQVTDATAVLADDLVPGRAVVRYRGLDVGTGYTYVELGKAVPPIRLRPATTISGRVGEPVAFWCFGWRCAGLRPVAGAEVLVMGGGEHGVDLAAATTDASGRFVIEGVDARLDGLGLRVRARGFAIAHEPLARFDEATPPPLPVVALARARVHSGKLVAPPAVDLTKLRVLARGLPGVQAVPSADGLFVLDHVPLGMEPRLVVAGLPDTWTHLPVRAIGGSQANVQIVPAAAVRGRVVDAASQEPLADALVYCGDQDAVRSDADGNYRLVRQLPGDVELEAKWEFVDSRRRRTPWFGRKRVVLEPGGTHDGVDILVTAR